MADLGKNLNSCIVQAFLPELGSCIFHLSWMTVINTGISATTVLKQPSFCKIRVLRKILVGNYPEEREFADLKTKPASFLLVLLALAISFAAYHGRLQPILQPTEVDIIPPSYHPAPSSPQTSLLLALGRGLNRAWRLSPRLSCTQLVGRAELKQKQNKHLKLSTDDWWDSVWIYTSIWE